jgi:hypothetical protein
MECSQHTKKKTHKTFMCKSGIEKKIYSMKYSPFIILKGTKLKYLQEIKQENGEMAINLIPKKSILKLLNLI